MLAETTESVQRAKIICVGSFGKSTINKKCVHCECDPTTK